MFGIWLRVHQLDERGIEGSDTVYYASLAESWAEGEPRYEIAQQNRVFRPVPLFLYSLAYRLLGFHDTTLKWVNVAADVASIFLVFLSLWIIRRDVVLALCAAATYSLLPKAIGMSRQELVHSISTTFLLLGLVLYLLSETNPGRWRPLLYLTLSGLAIGCAVSSHEELIFVSLPLLAAIVISAWVGDSNAAGWKTAGLRAALFASCLLTVSLPVVLAQVEPMSELARHRPGKTLLTPEPGHVALRLLHDGIVANGSHVLLGLFAALTLLALLRGLAKIRRVSPSMGSLAQHLPASMVLIYVGCCSVILRYYPLRVFLPLLPLVILAIFVYLAPWARGRLRAILPAALLVLIVVGNFVLYIPSRNARVVDFRGGNVSKPAVPSSDLQANWRAFRGEVYTATWPRRLYDLLRDRVSSDAKLLVTPAIAYSYPGRRVFQLKSYFGDDVVYVVDHEIPLADVVEQEKIRYVLFTSYQLDPRIGTYERYQAYRGDGRWERREPFVVGGAYGFGPGEYSLEAEWSWLLAFFESKNARLVTESHHLPDDEWLKLPPRGSYLIFELDGER